MEHLCNALKSVFAYQDGSEILRRYGMLESPSSCQDTRNGSTKYLYRETPESILMNLLQKANIYNTLDQKSIIIQVFQSKWMQPDYSIQYLKFNDEATVFNALLHFGAGTLNIQDNEPICRYHRLLRWHSLTTLLGEDIITTAFLASHDAALNQDRDSFEWEAVINHDNTEINALLSRPIADVHMHLNGSSFNFDLSWISLMNNFTELSAKFEELNDKYKNLSEWDPDIYSKMLYAASIRYYLASSVNLVADHISIIDLCNAVNPYSTKNPHRENPTPNIQTLINKRNNELKHQYNDRLVIPDEYIPILWNEKANRRMSMILSSERKLLYLCFLKIFRSEKVENDFATIFYAYLSYKSYFRQQILQLDEQVGFANFRRYESRKDTFILPKYNKIFHKAAICNFLNESPTRFLEARITPKNTPEELSNKINRIINNIQEPSIETTSKTLSEKDDCSALQRFGLILHFIKSRDEQNDKAYRHADLIDQIKQQCFSIYKFRNDKSNWETNPLAGYVVGIDAANSEIFCRPEVFGQAYRFLRGHSFENSKDGIHPNDLKFTFHVGEDFLDIADGLRAIEEAIIFLGLKHGDRIGHGLVLGTDVAKYYEKRYFTVCASKQVLLDNAAWLYHKCRRLGGSFKLLEFFECIFQKYFNEVFCNYKVKDKKSYFNFLEGTDVEKNPKDYYSHIKELNNINDYYLSWLIRGNHPKFGVEIPKVLKNEICDPIEHAWIEASINHHPAPKMAWHNPNARELFDAYHRTDVIQRGYEGDTILIPHTLRSDFIALLMEIQEQLLNKLEEKRIGIECNPTSNYKIGELERYDEHPIFRFYNKGLSTPFKRHDLLVSINTDDLGVFSTSLEREYSLVALAAERNYCKNFNNTPRQIIDWLDNIRKMSIEQLFITHKYH